MSYIRNSFISLVLLVACSSEKFSENGFIGKNLKLKYEGELKLNFDNETSAFAYNIYRYDKYNDELLILPQGVNKLKRHSTDTGEFLGEIILETSGPNGIGRVDAANYMFEVIGKDSLLLYSDWNSRLILVNRLGEVKDKFNLTDAGKNTAKVNYVTKILYQEGKVSLFTYDNLRSDESFNYLIDLKDKDNGIKQYFPYNKENLKKADILKNTLFFDPARTLNKNGDLMVVFPFIDTIYTWRENKIIKKGFTTRFERKNKFPKNELEFNAKIYEYGEREYLNSFAYNSNIEFLSELGVILVFSTEGKPLGTDLGTDNKSKRFKNITFFDNHLNIIGQDYARAEFDLATFFDGKYLYLASTENNLSEDELNYSKHAITQD